MEQITKIFISSTMDLKAERDAVTDVINHFKGVPIKMELFEARTKTSEEVCMEEVSKSDIYVGIFGKRYGFIPSKNNPNNLSVTAMEFEKARALKIPTLIFIQKNNDREPELETFLASVGDFNDGVFRKTYNSIDNLKYWLLASFVSELKRKAKKKTEKEKIEQLSVHETSYKNFVKKTCEYADLKGLYQLRKVVQLKLKDIYIPLKFRKLQQLNEESLEYGSNNSINHNQKTKMISSLSKIVLDDVLPYTRIVPLKTDAVELSVNEKTEVNLFQIISTTNKIVILGGPGSGKTTTFRRFAGSLIDEQKFTLTPFFVPLREYARLMKVEENLPLLDFIEKYFELQGLTLPKDFFKLHFASGGCVIMFDGLDEILSDRERILIASRIEQFSACFGEKNTIIVSSRIPSYRAAQLAGFDHFVISKLDGVQISSFVKNWTHKIEGSEGKLQGEKLLKILLGDQNIFNLSKNPLLLSLVCLIGIQGIPIPRKKADLYDVCVKTLISSWEEKKGYKGEFGEPQKFELLKRIAFYFVKNDKITATEYELLDLIQQVIDEFATLPNKQSQVKTILKNIVERSGLLIEREPNNFGFIHLGIRDYLSASYLAGCDCVKDMFEDFLKPRLHCVQYEQMICLCSRILEHQSTSRASIFLDSLLTANSPYEEIMHWDLELAIKCLFSCGVSGGKTVNQILEKLKCLISSEKLNYLNYLTVNEIDFEIFENYFFKLIKGIRQILAVDILNNLTFIGVIPRKGQFCQVALKLLITESKSKSFLSSYNSIRVIAKWAISGNKGALRFALDSIKSDNDLGKRFLEKFGSANLENTELLQKLFEVLDCKTMPIRKELFVYLYELRPEDVIKKIDLILKNDGETTAFKEFALKIRDLHTKSPVELEKIVSEHFEHEIDALLNSAEIAKFDDRIAYKILKYEFPSKEYLFKIIAELPEIFKKNRFIAFRLMQLIAKCDEKFELKSRINNLARAVSKTDSNQLRFIGYLFANGYLCNFPRIKKIAFDLILDEKEALVVRRSALTTLGILSIKLSKKDLDILVELLKNELLRNNVFFVLRSSEAVYEKMLNIILQSTDDNMRHFMLKQILTFNYYH